MSNVLLFNKSIPEIGYYVRTAKAGKELEMVERYVDCIASHFKKLKKKNVAIFIEPQLESGYPDIVLAEYCDKSDFSIINGVLSDNCVNERLMLKNSDLKILYYLQSNSESTKKEISDILGFSNEEIDASLTRLNSCKLVNQSSISLGKIRSVHFNKYCTITNLIAIEAKIDKWGEAIQQAESNRWFASESYILMNKKDISEKNLYKCQGLGLGIILVNGKVVKQLKGDRRKFPISYGSLLFNEWIQKALFLEKEKVLLK